jgi:hypothetical protein
VRRSLAAALLALAACGEAEPAAAPSSPPSAAVRIEPGGPPSVPVLQAAPGSISAYGWLTGTLAYAIDGPLLHVWDPATGRVVLVAPVPGLPAEHDPSRVHRVGRRVVVSHHELLLDRGELAETTYDLLSPEPTTFASIARDHDGHDLPLEELELALHHGGAEAPGRVRMPRDAQVSYSPDATTLMVCTDDAVRFYDAASGAERAALVLEEVTECAWPEGAGAIVVVASRALHLVDPETLVAGPPMAHVLHAHVSPDGRRLAMATTSAREGITVAELATGRELLHFSRRAPDAVRVVGDLAAYRDEGSFGPPSGDVRRIGGAPDGAVLAAGPAVSVEHIGPLGVLVVEDGVLTLRNTVGDAVARDAHPVAAALSLDDGTLLAHAGGASFWLDEGGAHRFGACPDERTEYGVVPATATHVGTRRYLVRRGCVAADDGSSGGAGPLDATGDGRVSLWVDGGNLVLHEGDARRPLRLDDGEDQPCGHATCPMPVSFSPDGAWLAVVRGPLLRVFDTSTGEVTHRAPVGSHTGALAFLSSGALVQEDSGGVLRVFAPPGRGPLRERAHRPHERARPAVVSGDWVLDVDVDRLDVLDARGRSLGTATIDRHSPVLATGTSSWVTSRGGALLLRLPGLEEVARTAGRPVAVVGPDAFLCRGDGVLVRVREADGRLGETESHSVCPETVVPFGAGWLVSDGLGTVSLLRSDGRALPLVAVRHGDGIALGGVDGDRAVSPARWMLRRPGLTAEGMTEVEPAVASVEAWLAEAR